MSSDRELAGPRALRLRVRGRVQGVGFRYFVLRSAQRRGVNGYVRNLADGSVEVRVEGAPESVEALVDDVAAGPAMAKVTRVEREELEPAGGSGGFEIRY